VILCPTGNRRQQRHLIAVVERPRLLGVRTLDDRQGGAQRRPERRMADTKLPAKVRNGGGVREFDRQQRRRREPRES
jgi:hypothetical protein